MASLPSHATPTMLAWARKSAGLEIGYVEEKDHIKPGSLAEWESGKGTPTFATLKKLAKRYHRPVPVFYLPEPPQGFNVVRDFRTIASDESRDFSPELRFAIRAAQERQSWASEYLRDEGYERCEFVGTLSPKVEVSTAIRKVRGLLEVQPLAQIRADTDSSAYRFWRRTAEAAGVFVFAATGVSTTEMRGLALSDSYAPAIVVNNSDSYQARSFTLIHELVHILIGDTAVSGPLNYQIQASLGDPTEQFCNSVATEILVPRADFSGRIPADWGARYESVIRTLARRYWVSPSVIAIRLHETGFASQEFVRERLAEAKAHAPKKREGPVKIPQQTLAISRVGESFSRHAISAYRGGELGGGELSALLNLRMKHLPALEQAVYPNSVHPVSSTDVL